ncbi:MFS transporter [Nonomuraea deserti]|nr:MFS transporter [Nonomuraea deserti]
MSPDAGGGAGHPDARTAGRNGGTPGSGTETAGTYLPGTRRQHPGAGQVGADGGASGVGGGRPVVAYAVAALGMGAFVALYNAAGFRLSAPPISLGPAAASLVFLAYAMGTASSAAAGRMAARLGRTPALVTALMVTVAGTVMTAHPALPLIALGFAVLTAGFFAAHAIANAWVTAATAPRARGRAAGMYALAYYLGSGVGGTAGGVVYGHAGWTWLVVLTSAWLLVAGLAVLVSRAGRERRLRP